MADTIDALAASYSAFIRKIHLERTRANNLSAFRALDNIARARGWARLTRDAAALLEKLQ